MLSLVSEMFTFLRLLFLAYLGADYHIFHKLDSLTALLLCRPFLTTLCSSCIPSLTEFTACSNSFHPTSNKTLGSEELITILTISYFQSLINTSARVRVQLTSKCPGTPLNPGPTRGTYPHLTSFGKVRHDSESNTDCYNFMGSRLSTGAFLLTTL